MVKTHRKTYVLVAQTSPTFPRVWWDVSGAGVLRKVVRIPAVLHSEGELQEVEAVPTADRNALVQSPPQIRPSDLEDHTEWFQIAEGESDEAKDGVKSETESLTGSVEGSSFDSPSEANLHSPVALGVRSPRSLGWNTQRRRGAIPPQTASTNGRSVPFARKDLFFSPWFRSSPEMEGMGGCPGVCNVGDYSFDSDEEEEHLHGAINRSIAQAERPVHTDQAGGTSHLSRRRQSSRRNEYKECHTWFDLSEDEDQLGPIPETWNIHKSDEHDENNFLEATRRSTVDVSQPGVMGMASSMAVTVQDQETEIPGRYKAKRKKERREPKPTSKGSYMRSSSQLPEGGWFRKSTASVEDTPSSSSSETGPSSASSSGSDSDSSTAEVSNSKSNNGHTTAKKRKAGQRRERAMLKKGMKGIKLKPPFVWDAKPDLDVFDHWTYEVDTWAELTGLDDSLVLKLMRTNTVRDFVREVRKLAERSPDVTERQLALIFWEGVQQYIRLIWLERGMSPEESSLDRLTKWAVRFERSQEALAHEQSEGRNVRGRRAWNEYAGSPGDLEAEVSDAEENVEPNGRWFSEDEMAQLRAENRCFNCTETGHRSRNCPRRQASESSQVSVAAARYRYAQGSNVDSSEDEHLSGDSEPSTHEEAEDECD
ncbi:hypothetical protein C8F04DRAFT_1340980 [Mycena alexandri]|uniref:CCHC-type domain-containing protein n=1 Tax=Mycena alexandri TaxID=1745969 RepID=A0AAD6SZX6_9AGAR|nr:hypothetical protein C8F04DRAFT_1340980 [Mycena alexandri]